MLPRRTMKTLIVIQTTVATLAAFTLLSGCGGSGFNPETLDGAELVALMDAAGTALVDQDREAWTALVPDEATSEIGSDFETLMAMRSHMGGPRFRQVLTPPDLGEVTLYANIQQFDLTLWFDFCSRSYYEDLVFMTNWSFERHDRTGDWSLAGVAISLDDDDYDALHISLNLLSPREFRSLAMAWEEQIDPTPLLITAREAIQNRDTDQLLRCSVYGAFLAAQEKQVKLPLVATEGYDARYNLSHARNFLSHQISEMTRMAQALEFKFDDIDPLFTIFPIQTMPENGSRIRMKLYYGGRRLSFGTSQIVIAWTGVWIHERWLADSLYIEKAERMYLR